MKTKYFISFIAVGFLIIGSAFLSAKILAQETTGAPSIQYPVAELGNCQDKTACKTYCDKPESMEACLDFAQKNKLMSEGEITTAKKFADDEVKKPGDCATKDSCEAYCDDIDHIDECLAFAQENNLIPPKELEEAKKVQAAIKRGIKPPACGNKESCDIYCDSSEHMEECINFAIEAGFMNEQEKANSQKMLAAVKKGVKPPNCKGQEACDEYCGSPDHMEECMTFAIEAGFMNEQEKANSQKMLAAVKKGVKPPNCKGEKECDVYCGQEEHFEECLNFAEAAGFMSPEEAEMSRRTGGKGPGGCQGKDECDAFCNNPDNQEACFNFAKDNGLIPEEDLKRMEEGKQQFKQSLEQAPQEILDCLNSQIGKEMLEKIKSGAVMPPREIGENMRVCYEKMGPPEPGEPGQGGIIPPPGQAGPGGCATPEECKAYCETHIEECQNFQPMMPQNSLTGPQEQQGIPEPGQMSAGPGGCRTPEECQTYCASNPQECRSFKPPLPNPGPTGQNGPTMGPDNGMGMSNDDFMQVQTVCENPEQCKQMEQQIQTQIQNQVQQQGQNQMASPQACQGDNCNYGPPPNQPDGQAAQQYQRPPATGEYPTQMTSQQPATGTQMPSEGPMPNTTAPMPITDQYPDQPQQYQQYQELQQPQIQNQIIQPQQPAPGAEMAPPPVSFLGPQSFAGSIITIFNQTLRVGK